MKPGEITLRSLARKLGRDLTKLYLAIDKDPIWLVIAFVWIYALTQGGK
jgi:hypothetical protein